MPPTWLAVAAKHIGGALVVCIGWTAFFALCGLICVLVTGDWPFMGALTAFGIRGVIDFLIQSGSLLESPSWKRPKFV